MKINTFPEKLKNLVTEKTSIKIKKELVDQYRAKFAPIGNGYLIEEYDEDDDSFSTSDTYANIMQWCILGEKDGVIDTVIELEGTGDGCEFSAQVSSAILVKAYLELQEIGRTFVGFLPIPTASYMDDTGIKRTFKSSFEDLEIRKHFIRDWSHHTHAECTYVNLFVTEFGGQVKDERVTLKPLELV